MNKKLFDIYLKILEACITKEIATQSEIATYSNIPEHSNYIKQLLDSELIKKDGSFLKVTPNGFSTYLNILAINQSRKQFLVATGISTISIFVATAALLISIFGFK